MKKKRTIRVVLAAVAAGLLLCAPKPQVVKAEGSWENVTEGGIIYQCVTDTESDMYEKALVYGVNDDFKSNGTIADIQSSVTDDKGKEYPVIAIGGELAGAFSGCTKLNKVNIPNSVLSIGEGAFSECESLQTITIPDSVTDVEGQAFIDCTSLSSVKLSAKIKSLKKQTFDGCTSLKSIEIPASVESIDGAFDDNLATVTFASGSKLTTIKSAFTYTSIKSIKLPDSVTTIGDDSFGGCKELVSVELPTSLKSIGKAAFRACPKLTTVVVPDGTTEIGEEAFNSYIEDKQSGLTTITIPKSVTTIAENAFNSSNPITMYGYTGSKAESYAKAKSNITFIALDKPVTIKNAYFSVTVPASWVGKYDLYTDPTEKTPSFVSFYSQKCYTETNGQAGWLFAIATFTDESYKELPAYKVLKKSGGQTYVFEEPTDVQTEGVSAEARAEYGELLKDAEAICKTLKVTAAPNKPVIKSVKNTKGKKAKITIKKKISGAAGYEYSYDTSKKFKSAKSKSAKKTSLTLTKLKKKKTYYVRVRAYKTVNGAKIYSSWSAVKSVKIKK